MKAILWIVFMIVILGIVAFTIFGYAGYFQVEQKSLETSNSALEAGKATKAMLENKDSQLLNNIKQM